MTSYLKPVENLINMPINMTNNHNYLGYWIRRFLMEYLILDKNYSVNTQKSYRDTFRLLLPFIANRLHKTVDNILVDDVDSSLILSFLNTIENERKCSISTRNQRLAAVASLARYIGCHCPEYVIWCQSVRNIPIKRSPKNLITYLEKDEIDALLAAPDMNTSLGRRDHALLLFLYNSGARVEEAATLQVQDLTIPRKGTTGFGIAQIKGKGGKTRRCPLWSITCKKLQELTKGKSSSDYVFSNRLNNPLTRFGVYEIVRKYAIAISAEHPQVLNKRLTPHTIRHTTATHLLQSGVDINTIRAWLGHVSLNTTNIYAEVNLAMKAKALEQCIIPDAGRKHQKWRDNKDLMTFLDSL